MNTKKATNLQLSTTESKKKKTTTTTKQTTRIGMESQVQKPFGGLPAGREKGENGGNCAGIQKHNWQVQNRQGDVKNSIGNGEAKELICMTHGNELRRVMLERKGVLGRGRQRGKIGTTVIA